MKTAAEQLERMDALVQKIARSELSGTLAEAQAILAEREKPDDDDLAAARICNASPYRLDGIPAAKCGVVNDQIHAAVLEGIKHGRAAAKGKHEERFVKVHTTMHQFVLSENIQMSVTAESRLTRDILAALDR